MKINPSYLEKIKQNNTREDLGTNKKIKKFIMSKDYWAEDVDILWIAYKYKLGIIVIQKQNGKYIHQCFNFKNANNYVYIYNYSQLHYTLLQLVGGSIIMDKSLPNLRCEEYKTTTDNVEYNPAVLEFENFFE